nr:MAG TPA: envelope glycoprotein [Caudoviricetes sp.]
MTKGGRCCIFVPSDDKLFHGKLTFVHTSIRHYPSTF